MEQTIGKASLRDAVIATGVSVDKVALLTGPKMGLLVNIANISRLRRSKTQRERLRTPSWTRSRGSSAKARNRARMPADAPSLFSALFLWQLSVVE